ncbi:MAG TPA: nitrilase-related carbon-nitrogen hydrolase [Spirochaetia bacterium]
MEARNTRRALCFWVCLLAAGAAYAFTGWRFNVPFAPWIAAVLLIRFARGQRRWTALLAAIPVLALASFVQMNGGWDLEPWMVALACVVRPAPFIAALFVDRALRPRLPRWASTLAFPTIALAVDYAIALSPLGSGMAIGATQFEMPVIAQLASVTGIWGIELLLGWIAAVVATLWEEKLDLSRVGRLAAVAGCVLLAVVAYGSARYALTRPASPTVRVGSITVPHARDYWAWIDQGTPRSLVEPYAGELAALDEELFRQSGRAVAAGARIVFWSEGDGVITEDGEQAFKDRAAAFARDNNVYFAPAILVLRYGQGISDNKIVMFTPEGREAYTYVKTMSWYPTGSDGVLKVADTPYGRIGAAICFDMDFPGFIHGLARQKVDIVLVPAFDKERIRPFHTEVGLMRGIENGFSVVRQTNEGTSLAIDGSGRVVARQEFFETKDRLMLADVPTRRVPTVASALGDLFAYAGILVGLALVVWGILRAARSGRRSARA